MNPSQIKTYFDTKLAREKQIHKHWLGWMISTCPHAQTNNKSCFQYNDITKKKLRRGIREILKHDTRNTRNDRDLYHLNLNSTTSQEQRIDEIDFDNVKRACEAFRLFYNKNNNKSPRNKVVHPAAFVHVYYMLRHFSDHYGFMKTGWDDHVHMQFKEQWGPHRKKVQLQSKGLNATRNGKKVSRRIKGDIRKYLMQTIQVEVENIVLKSAQKTVQNIFEKIWTRYSEIVKNMGERFMYWPPTYIWGKMAKGLGFAIKPWEEIPTYFLNLPSTCGNPGWLKSYKKRKQERFEEYDKIWNQHDFDNIFT